jgi:hypothetical protein
MDIANERGKPRLQYERAYVLVHASTSAEDVKRVAAACWDEKRFTIGQSADDAGIGDLDERNVLVVDARPWGGEPVLKAWFDEWYPGCILTFVDSVAQFERLMGVHTPASVPTRPARFSIGVHDRPGGEWMARNGLRGACLVHEVVQKQARKLDYRALHDVGITVICRLNWGYADGTGTLPRPQDRTAFVDAVASTILQANGADYFHVGNEPNNRSEWPDGYELTPEYVVDLYNELWCLIGKRAKIGPPPIDPYFGPGSNNREWWRYILERIAGADALFLHPKTQTNDPTEVESTAKFSEDPLRWQYLHLRTVDTSLEVVPERFASLPVFATEVNPQRMSNGALGWDDDSAAWVYDAAAFLKRRVSAAIFYRWEATGNPSDPQGQYHFGLEHKPKILDAIKVFLNDKDT